MYEDGLLLAEWGIGAFSKKAGTAVVFWIPVPFESPIWLDKLICLKAYWGSLCNLGHVA